jgi:hypothetical protein
MEETVTIPKAEYEVLKKEVEFLYALKASGVDSFAGYESAIDYMNETYPEDDAA